MTLRACKCGCEGAVVPMRYLNGHSGRVAPVFYLNRHHRRGTKHVGKTGHERDVASSVVMDAVAARGVPIRRLAEWTGIAPIRLYSYRNGNLPWMTKRTAERILAAVRHVALVEVRKATVPDDVAFMTAGERADHARRRDAARRADSRGRARIGTVPR